MNSTLPPPVTIDTLKKAYASYRDGKFLRKDMIGLLVEAYAALDPGTAQDSVNRLQEVTKRQDELSDAIVAIMAILKPKGRTPKLPTTKTEGAS